MKFGSLFSGIGGFDLGLERAGLVPAWQCEIDYKASAVLARHWPTVERHTDVRLIGKHNLEPVDLICGGFPCQDVSVAGKRAGLAGERSGLWHEFRRVLEECRPRWAVIENVPGLLSSNDGRDFAVILLGLAELGYGVCWRVLDAQYFGLAQRRRRVFIVGSLGDGRAAEVLFEREGGAWDSPPSREKRPRITQLAGTLAANAGGTNRPAGNANEPDFCVVGALAGSGDDSGWRIGADEAANGQLISGTLNSSMDRGLQGQDAHSDMLLAFGGNNTQGPIEVATAQRSKGGTGHGDFESETFITHPLKAEGADASEDGTGRGVPLVFDTTQITSPDNYSNPQPGDPCHPLAEGAHPPAIVFESRFARNGRGAPDTVVPPLKAESGQSGKGDGAPLVAFSGDRDGADSGEIVPTLKHGGSEASAHGAYKKPSIAGNMGVRRLMPVECERLQGFPDGWTDGQTDSHRYRQLGNAVAVPCAEWLGRRLLAAELERI